MKNFISSIHFHLLQKKKENILGFTKNQGVKFTSAVYDDRIIGTQFHPEKSGEVGLEFLKETITHFS